MRSNMAAWKGDSRCGSAATTECPRDSEERMAIGAVSLIVLGFEHAGLGSR
jgi:hypothetical protein